jgi:hypothetical protein
MYRPPNIFFESIRWVEVTLAARGEKKALRTYRRDALQSDQRDCMPAG